MILFSDSDTELATPTEFAARLEVAPAAAQDPVAIVQDVDINLDSVLPSPAILVEDSPIIELVVNDSDLDQHSRDQQDHDHQQHRDQQVLDHQQHRDQQVLNDQQNHGQPDDHQQNHEQQVLDHQQHLDQQVLDHQQHQSHRDIDDQSSPRDDTDQQPRVISSAGLSLMPALGGLDQDLEDACRKWPTIRPFLKSERMKMLVRDSLSRQCRPGLSWDLNRDSLDTLDHEWHMVDITQCRKLSCRQLPQKAKRPLRVSLGSPGTSWVASNVAGVVLGVVLGSLGANLVPSWAALRPSWAHLGQSLGSSRAPLGASKASKTSLRRPRGHMRLPTASWGQRGFMDASWANLGPVGSFNTESGSILDTFSCRF